MPSQQSSYQRRSRRRKLILLTALLLAVALAGFLLWRYYRTKHLALPTIAEGRPGEQIAPPTYLFSFDGGPNPGRALQQPQGVAVHPNGNIYVASSGNRRVEVFDHDGRWLFNFKGEVGNGQVLRRPVYVETDSKGLVYVADRRLKDVFVFKADGTFVKKFQPDRQKTFQWMPLGLKVSTDGSLYATDILQVHQFFVFNPDGTMRLKIGNTGYTQRRTEQPTVFAFPNGLIVDDAGDIYVADSDNGRVQVFDKNGKFLRALGVGGVLRGIDFEYRGYIMISDALGHDVIVIDKKGNILTAFGEQGFGPGQFWYPNALAFSPSDRRIYITDRENHRVQVWVWGPDMPPALRRAARALCPWWWVPLLLLPLIYWLLRRKKYLLHEDFIEVAIAEEKLEFVISKLKRVYATPSTWEKFNQMQVGERTFGDEVAIKDYYEDLVEEFEKEYKLDHEAAVALSACKKGIGRVVLLAEDQDLLDSADTIGVPNMNFYEFMEKYEVPGMVPESEESSRR